MTEVDPADVLRIHDLIYRYAAANDVRDIDAVVECFEPDGAFSLQVVGQDQVGPVTHDALRGLYTDMLGAQDDQRRHVITNTRVALVADGRCEATSYFTLVVTDAGVTRTLTAGVYTDVVTWSDERGWRFATKHLDLDGQP